MIDQTSLGLRSLVKPDGALELSLAQASVSPPKDDEVIVRVEATPINPSDLGLLLAGGDVSLAKVSGKGSQTVVTAPIAPAAMRALSARVASEIRTTFASHYTRTISLLEALDPDVIAAYSRRATGEKFLINPSLAIE